MCRGTEASHQKPAPISYLFQLASLEVDPPFPEKLSDENSLSQYLTALS